MTNEDDIVTYLLLEKIQKGMRNRGRWGDNGVGGLVDTSSSVMDVPAELVIQTSVDTRRENYRINFLVDEAVSEWWEADYEWDANEYGGEADILSPALPKIIKGLDRAYERVTSAERIGDIWASKDAWDNAISEDAKEKRQETSESRWGKRVLSEEGNLQEMRGSASRGHGYYGDAPDDEEMSHIDLSYYIGDILEQTGSWRVDLSGSSAEWYEAPDDYEVFLSWVFLPYGKVRFTLEGDAEFWSEVAKTKRDIPKVIRQAEMAAENHIEDRGMGESVQEDLPGIYDLAFREMEQQEVGEVIASLMSKYAPNYELTRESGPGMWIYATPSGYEMGFDYNGTDVHTVLNSPDGRSLDGKVHKTGSAIETWLGTTPEVRESLEEWGPDPYGGESAAGLEFDDYIQRYYDELHDIMDPVMRRNGWDTEGTCFWVTGSDPYANWVEVTTDGDMYDTDITLDYTVDDNGRETTREVYRTPFRGSDPSRDARAMLVALKNV